MIYITRKAHFNAAHKLYNPDWSEEKNKNVFGKCANKNYHGHNFDLYITVKGEPDANTGFVMNSKDLGTLIRKHVTEKIDHKNLNLDVDFMKNMQPTVENLIQGIWQQLEPHIEGAELHRIRLWETRKFFADYYGN